MCLLLNSVLTLCFILSSVLGLLYSSIALSSLHAEPLQTTTTNNSNWNAYPGDLQQFDYSGDSLQQHWAQLAAATNLSWPDSGFIADMMARFPKLSQRLALLAKQDNAHPALKNTLTGDYQGLALAVQQVWRLHFQGQYEEAYQQGLKLGPAGLGPALYAKLIYITHLVPTSKEKERLLLEVDAAIKTVLPYADNYSFILFGDAYQKARRLELMSTTAASSSGLIGTTQDSLRDLNKADPGNPLYNAMLAGIDAGIIERVGNFVGSMTYGTDEDKSLALFNDALKSHPSLAVLHNEFAQFILRLDDSDYDELLLKTLKRCDQLAVFSAEEALNQQACRDYLQKLEHK